MKTEGTIKNEQSRQHRRTHDEETQNKNTTQYVLDTTIREQTQKHNTICVGHHYT